MSRARWILLFGSAFVAGGWSSALAQSGYLTIRDTRVFVVVDQAAGIATFSNDCGRQILTQRQLQAGATPDQIIPCPRRGTSAPSRRPASGASTMLPPNSGGTPNGCEAAKENIEWAICRDFNARGTYNRARGWKSPLDAVLYAQRHNRSAQASIRRCAWWAGPYAATLERTCGRPAQAQPARPPQPPRPPNTDADDLACVDTTNLGVVDDQFYELRRAFGGDPVQWARRVRIPMSLYCRQAVEVFICVYVRGQQAQLYRKTYGGGFMSENPVQIIVTNARPQDVRMLTSKCLRKSVCNPGC